MKSKLLLLFLLITSIKNFGQGIFLVPETWEVDTWSGTGWTNFSQTTYTFNGSCMPTFILSQAINPMTTLMENTTQETITYNDVAPQVVNVTEVWDTNNSLWSNFQKSEHTYNENDDVIETKNYNWVGSWQLASRTVSTYGSPGLVSQTTYQTWDIVNTIWVNSTNRLFTYINNQVETETSYNWDVVNSIWVEDNLETNTYNGTLLATSQRQKWDGAQWENNYFETYTYDGNDYLIETIETKWNGASYDNNKRTDFTNNSQGYPITMVVQSWIINTWVNTSRDRRTYPGCALLSVNEIGVLDVSVYPNPSRSNISVDVKESITYSITNINGQLVKEGIINQINNKINISSFNSGLYFLNLERKNQSVTKKIIKL